MEIANKIKKSEDVQLFSHLLATTIASATTAGLMGICAHLVKFPLTSRETTSIAFTSIAIPLGLFRYKQFKKSLQKPFFKKFSPSDLKEDEDFYELDEEDMKPFNPLINQLTKKEKSLIQIEPAKRLCLIGPPGGGKTLYAKNIAYKLSQLLGAQVPFFNIDTKQFMSPFANSGPILTSMVFEDIKKQLLPGQPAVIFIDEIDSICKQRGYSEHDDQRTTALMTEIEGFQSNSNIIIIGATNKWELMDDAVRSRFDNNPTFIPLPDISKRTRIIKKHFAKKINDTTIRTQFFSQNDPIISNIARMTEGCDGRDLRSLVKSILIHHKEIFEKKEFSLRDTLVNDLTLHHLLIKNNPHTYRGALPSYDSSEWHIQNYNRFIEELKTTYQESTANQNFPLSTLLSPEIKTILKTTILPFVPLQSHKKNTNQNILYLNKETQGWYVSEKEEFAQWLQANISKENKKYNLKQRIKQEIEKRAALHQLKRDTLTQVFKFSLASEQQKYILWNLTLESLPGKHNQFFSSLYFNNPQFDTCLNNFLKRINDQRNEEDLDINTIKGQWHEELQQFNKSEQQQTALSLLTLHEIYREQNNKIQEYTNTIENISKNLQGSLPTWHNLYYWHNPQKRNLYHQLKEMKNKKQEVIQEAVALHQSIEERRKHYETQENISAIELHLPNEPAILLGNTFNYLQTSLEKHTTQYNALSHEIENSKKWYHIFLLQRKNEKYQSRKKLEHLINLEEEHLQLLTNQLNKLANPPGN
jgi:SpoVK/Ycf46/Vps4 family AAA+-type ATPase